MDKRTCEINKTQFITLKLNITLKTKLKYENYFFSSAFFVRFSFSFQA